MKVKELIELLNKYDKNLEIGIYNVGYCYTHEIENHHIRHDEESKLIHIIINED